MVQLEFSLDHARLHCLARLRDLFRPLNYMAVVRKAINFRLLFVLYEVGMFAWLSEEWDAKDLVPLRFWFQGCLF
jgi:hypothetical protein